MKELTIEERKFYHHNLMAAALKTLEEVKIYITAAHIAYETSTNSLTIKMINDCISSLKGYKKFKE